MARPYGPHTDGCERLRTVANGCERLDNIQRTQLYPHTPRVKREPLLRIRENNNLKLGHEIISVFGQEGLPMLPFSCVYILLLCVLALIDLVSVLWHKDCETQESQMRCK